MRIFIGYDTSNYTTSAAVVNEYGDVLLNAKKLLPVKSGERGLRQSDAVFSHVKQLPEISAKVDELLKSLSDYTVSAVGYSSKPRNAADSYMPCFLVGQSAASAVASVTGVELYSFSHQENHIMAALSSACRNNGIESEKIMSDKFIAFHVSGGTTDVLLCSPSDDSSRTFNIEQIGGTKDLNAGQVIDRCGVMMGMAFPCGAEIDRLAVASGIKPAKERLSVSGTWTNLSGLENKCAELYNKTSDKALTGTFVLDFIARTLEKITLNAFEEYGKMPVIYAGGVMSSEYIKQRLSKYGMFSDPQYSSDNACGTALLTMKKYLSLSEGKDNGEKLSF